MTTVFAARRIQRISNPLFENPLRIQNAQQTRCFLDSLLGSALGPCPLRSLTHTKNIPYSANAVFKAVSDVSGYLTFLPFTIESKVTQRDDSGYPKRALLKVGYDKFGLEENWDSIVTCNPEQGTIEARSSDENSQGLFEVLKTKWKIESVKNQGLEQTLVKLDVDVKFRNPIYDQMFAQVESRVVNSMITAFEKRVKELERKG